jgi:hypothetical protein
MACASLSRTPVAPDSLTRSLPARSMRLRTPETWGCCLFRCIVSQQLCVPSSYDMMGVCG